MSRVHPGSCELYNVRKRDVTQAGRKMDANDILSLFSSLQSTTHVQHHPNGGTTYEWSDTSKKVRISIYKLLLYYQLYTCV